MKADNLIAWVLASLVIAATVPELLSEAKAYIEYSPWAYEYDAKLSEDNVATVDKCLSTSQSPYACVESTLPNCKTTPEQCLYAEAYAWDRIGKRSYEELAGAIKAVAALENSQSAWKVFARSACAFVGALDSNQPFQGRTDMAECILKILADRAIGLRQYARQVKPLQ